MNGPEAQRLIAGLVFGLQKDRSILRESLGNDEVAKRLLTDLHPHYETLLPRVLDWQRRTEREGWISGMDLFNFYTIILMKLPSAILVAALNGFDMPERADATWCAQMWDLTPSATVAAVNWPVDHAEGE